MRARIPILLYCADRELLADLAYQLRRNDYDVTTSEDSRNALACIMASRQNLACGVLLHTQQGDPAGRLIHRMLEADIAIPLLLIDRAGDLAPVRYAEMVLYGRNTSIGHILTALNLLCIMKRRITKSEIHREEAR